MNVRPASLPDVLILEPKVFGDERGFFFESYNARVFADKTGINAQFVQDNHSRSARNVLRGLHYQIQQAQDKLVRVIAGEIYDVSVDIRKQSATFGKWTANVLSMENRKMLWIPKGFAHGFVVTSDFAEVEYKTTDYWAPQFERCILWNDPALNIPWPLQGAPQLSAKDQQGRRLADAELPG
jgi:dTDP-4-dehydrorhamnose 3,5-epimerase